MLDKIIQSSLRKVDHMTRKLFTYSSLRVLWRELFYRPRWYGDNHHELERLFQWSEDPWNFQCSRYEQARLQALLDHVMQYPHDTILEIGCAEGIFTEQLNKIAKNVVAIDVSHTALVRAKRRCAEVTFLKKSLQEFTWDYKFDLVVCAETLYYVKDVRSAIDKLASLGKYCLVSYVHRETKNLDRYFSRIPMVKRKKFQMSYGLWKRGMTVVIWENNGQTS